MSILMTIRDSDGAVMWKGKTSCVPDNGSPFLIPDDNEDLRLYRIEQQCWSVEYGIVAVSFIALPHEGHNRERGSGVGIPDGQSKRAES